MMKENDSDWRTRHMAPGSSAVHRQTDRASEEFRRASRHRHREHAAADELRQRTDELGRSVGELRALGEVSQAVNSTLDLETVLSTIVAKAVQLSGTEAGAIYVFDDLQREFHLRATYGMDQELIEALSHQHIGFDAPIFTPGSRMASRFSAPI